MTSEVNILMHMNILKVKNKILFALKCEQVMICLDSKSNRNTKIMNNKMNIITKRIWIIKIKIENSGYNLNWMSGMSSKTTFLTVYTITNLAIYKKIIYNNHRKT